MGKEVPGRCITGPTLHCLSSRKDTETQKGAETDEGPTVREKQSLSKPSPLAPRPALHSVLSVTHVSNFFNVGTFPKSYAISPVPTHSLVADQLPGARFSSRDWYSAWNSF